jgi:hypothetical protein
MVLFGGDNHQLLELALLSQGILGRGRFGTCVCNRCTVCVENFTLHLVLFFAIRYINPGLLALDRACTWGVGRCFGARNRGIVIRCGQNIPGSRIGWVVGIASYIGAFIFLEIFAWLTFYRSIC